MEVFFYALAPARVLAYSHVLFNIKKRKSKTYIDFKSDVCGEITDDWPRSGIQKGKPFGFYVKNSL